jgi:hypothetical protein
MTRDRRSWDEVVREAIMLSAMGLEEQGIQLMRAWHEERRRRRAQREAEDLEPDVHAPDDGGRER